MKSLFLLLTNLLLCQATCSIKNYQEYIFYDNDTCPIRNDGFKGSIVFGNESIQCYGYQGTCKIGKEGPKDNHGMRPEIASNSPTMYPSMLPTTRPTLTPTITTEAPTQRPSNEPSETPSSLPSALPSNSPSDVPTYLEYIVVPCNKTV